MLRALFTTLPAVGHALPLASIAGELHARGHDIAWVAHDRLRPHLLPGDAQVFPVPGVGELSTRASGRPQALLRAYFQHELPRAADEIVPIARTAIRSFAPDVVVTEQNCLAGSIAARLERVAWRCVQVTPILLVGTFAALPALQRWLDDQVGQIHRRFGVAPLPWPLRSEGCTIVASSAEFLGKDADIREGDLLVGALVAHRDHADVSELLGPRPRVLVSLGTLTAAGRRLVDIAIDALGGTGTLIVAGESCPRRATANVRFVQWVPQAALLPHLDALVGHGGQGTVSEALLAGVPMVLAPIQHDQPAVAARVEALGAGLTVSFEHATAADLRRATTRIVSEPGFAAAARRVGATLGPGGAAKAADAIEAAA